MKNSLEHFSKVQTTVISSLNVAMRIYPLKSRENVFEKKLQYKKTRKKCNPLKSF